MNALGRKGLVTAMVAGGVLASAAGYARADSSAGGEAAGSPGVLSGNSVQVPVHIPVNVCGNTVDVVGLLNPASGNTCVNSSGPAASSGSHGARPARPPHPGGSSGQTGRSDATGRAEGSPGVVSGNSVQVPVDVPVNVSGNTVNAVGVGNSAGGNTSVNGGTPSGPATPTPAPTPTGPAHHPVPAPPNEPRATAHDPGGSLAHTGAQDLGYAAGGSAALLLGGVVLYRRYRPGRA